MAKKPNDKKIVKKAVKSIVKATMKEFDKIDEPFDKARVEPKLKKAFNTADDKADRTLVEQEVKKTATYGTKADIRFAKKAIKKVTKKKK